MLQTVSRLVVLEKKNLQLVIARRCLEQLSLGEGVNSAEAISWFDC
ncbi:MAG: hypothetical protein WBA93_23830 [Microcoleaceae cyanobacterium]